MCEDHQETLERCIMQAHWSGLFPDKTTADFDRSGYKRFNRFWTDDMDMFTLSRKTIDGSWHYIKRYNPKVRELTEPIYYNKNPRRNHEKIVKQRSSAIGGDQ